MRDKTIIALAALAIAGVIQVVCVAGIILGRDGLLVGIFSGAGQIAGVVVGYYFGGKSEQGGETP